VFRNILNEINILNGWREGSIRARDEDREEIIPC
jgi:hypothetical protein